MFKTKWTPSLGHARGQVKQGIPFFASQNSLSVRQKTFMLVQNEQAPVD
jgi:hypothetical protein